MLRFDFTGLGDSDGDFSNSGFSGNVRDLIAANNHMKLRDIEPTMMIGHSLGGAAALAATAQLPNIVAVATIGAPFDVAHVTKLFPGKLNDIEQRGEAKVDLGGVPFTIRRSFIDDLKSYDSRQAIAHLGRPLLVLHSPLDQIVGIENASSIFLAARHPKSFVSLDHADHLLTNAADANYVADVIAAWTSRYLALSPEEPAVRDDSVVITETRAGKFQVEVRAAGTRFLADEPVDVGGLGSGPSPYQLLSASLGVCTAMTLRLYADQKKWPLERVSVTVNHAKRSGEPNDIFTRAIAIEGDLEALQQDRLMEIANKCPVHRTLERGSKVETCKAVHQTEISSAAMVSEPSQQHFIDMERVCEEQA